MNKFRFLTWSVIILLLLNAGTLVYLFTSKKNMPEPKGREGASDFIVTALKLDGQQRDQFFELRREHQEITRRIHDEDRRLHDQYFALLKTDHPDQRLADSISSQIGEQRSRLEAATFDHFRKLRNLCREDQKKLFDQTINEITRMMGPKGPPPGGPPRD